MPSLIVLRGNSGSGKSTVARLLRERARPGCKVAIVEQDYLRRIVLKEKESKGSANIGLIEQTASYRLGQGFHVVLEGILYSKRYGDMIRTLVDEADQHWAYYFNVSFEETLRRHASKPNAADFGEVEMRSWYNADDRLGIAREWIIPDPDDKLKQQIDRDRALLDASDVPIEQVTWHFFASDVSGYIADDPLLFDYLRANNIPYEIHLP